MKIKTRGAINGYLFLLPSLAGFSLMFLLPFFISLYYCFTKGLGKTSFAGLQNFYELLGSSSFSLAVLNTLKFNVICVPLIILVSIFLAVLLNIKIHNFRFFRTIFITPLVIPVASVILVWQITFNQYGFVNRLLETAGLKPVDWLGSEWSMVILILVYIWKNSGYNIVLFLAGLNSIPIEYYESAYIDGASSFECFTRITVPLITPVTFFVFVISMINSFKVFREAYLLAGSYPPSAMYMLQHFMNNNFYNLSYQRLSTASFIVAAAVAELVFLLFRLQSKFTDSTL